MNWRLSLPFFTACNRRTSRASTHLHPCKKDTPKIDSSKDGFDAKLSVIAMRAALVRLPSTFTYLRVQLGQGGSMKRTTIAKTVLQGTGVLAGGALAAAGGWWLYSRFGIEHHANLPPAIDVERKGFTSGVAGRLSHYHGASGSGTPLVLLHSVNAAASAFEMKPLFEHFRGERPVYALELPGFGFSNRAKRDYTPELFTAAVLEFLRSQVGEPADVVALSLSSEFAARAALKAPEYFKSLTLISPTGLDEQARDGGNETFYKVASQPLWARAFYDLIATPASIRYFLQGSFVGEVPEDLQRYSYLSAHQPGAEHAPLRFISGKLFTPNVRERVYEHLSVPTLILFDQDAFVSFETLPALLSANPKVQAVRLTPSRGLPQLEAPSQTAEVLRDFWRGLQVDSRALNRKQLRTVNSGLAYKRGRAIPKDRGFDDSLELLSEGYTFISKRCDDLQTDVFQTRLLLQKTICMCGRDAAELFYNRERFVRSGAAPRQLTQTLFGKGGVQGLDGEAHTRRKAMFMALMSEGELQRMVALTAEGWSVYAQKWTGAGQVVLFDETMELLFRAVCSWAGVPLQEDEVAKRTREMADLISSAAAIGPHYLEGRLSRHDAEHWAGGLIQEVRRGTLTPPSGTALGQIALFRDGDGNFLSEHTAAVELLNVIRPTVAVSRYLVFCAHALHEHPEWCERLREDDTYLEPFVQEVRRFYPFFPFAAARVKETFRWRGLRFEKGTRTLLDLYGTNHDSRLWEEPGAFKPGRFHNWQGDPYTLIPQGGGDHYLNHRCAGEWLTIEVMKEAVRALTRAVTYEVPPQDLTLELSKMPALPESGLVINNVRLASTYSAR